MIRRPPRSTQSRSSAASDVYKRQAQEIGRPTRVLPEPPDNSELRQKIETLGGDQILAAMAKPEKEARHLAMDQVKQEILAALGPEVEGREKEAKGLISEVKKKLVRNVMLTEQRRIDGRGFSDVRTITGEVGLLSRTHGSVSYTHLRAHETRHD